MRVAIDYAAAVHQGAGVGRFVRSLVDAMVDLDPETFFILFYGQEGPRKEVAVAPTGKNVELRPLWLSQRTLNVLWYKLGLPVPVDALTGPADVFHFPDFVLPPVRRGATVVTVHDLSFMLVPECADERLRGHLERVVPISVREADYVTADSENTRNDLMTLLDVPPERVEVVYSGVDRRFRPIADEAAHEAARRKYGLNFPFMLYVGTIEPRKNLRRLLKAYRIFRQQGRAQHKLVLAGGLGWLYQDILHDVEELVAEQEVVYLGRIPDDDLPVLYSLSDAFVFPSLYEGFGLPPLEAMACGTPVICSNTSSLPEVVGDAGILVPPEDVDGLALAMGALLNEPERRAVLGRRALERAQQFTWEAAAERVLSIYRRLGKA